ncbi:CapA family protein [Streptomyces sp. CAU 1734]|uniref:CapA family protein n=1 Tax=Streptomyces sp. CAU 1734 TaxID=3140360 RepID=UPI0032619036
MPRSPRRAAAVTAVLLGAAAAACAGPPPAGDRPVPGPAGSSPAAAGPPALVLAPAAPVAPPAGRPAAKRAFTLVASGDVLPHDSVIRRARLDSEDGGYDFAPMLAGVRPVVSAADLAICHMETVYGADGDYRGYPAFTSPPQVARGLADTGYDSCSTASNHSLDDGAEGIRRTLDALDAAGVGHTGSARTESEARTPAWLAARGARVAQLAYTYGTNGYPLPEGQPWAVAPMERDRILADARAARRAGADVVVVSLHWGTEWQTEPDEIQRELARGLTAAGPADRPDIDLIIGTHAHVPQAYEKVNGTWVVYGMGDQIAGPMFNHSGGFDARGNQGSIARFTFAPPLPPLRPDARWEVRRAEFIPQLMDIGAGRVINVADALDRGADRDDYREALESVRTAVLSRGASADGLTMSSR